METELGLMTSAAWAVNNLAHDSQENVAMILDLQGVSLLLRIIKYAAVSLLGLLADGQQELQDEVADAGGLELLLSLAKSSHGDDVTVSAVRTFALLLVDNPSNQKK
eukprot:scaffold647826_cov51-Prasinocladus_malaysianus.AAC.1